MKEIKTKPKDDDNKNYDDVRNEIMTSEIPLAELFESLEDDQK